MASLDDIKSAIKTIAESITDIGNVYDQVPPVNKWDEVLKNFISDNKLKILLFTKTIRNPQVISEQLSSFRIQHKWTFKYIYSSNVANESEKTFDNLCELICNTINANERLNNTIKRKDPISQPNKRYAMVCGILCHYAEFELTTYVDSIDTAAPVLPDQVVLSSPADGLTSGPISGANFEWEAAAHAETYHYQISTTSNFISPVFQQENLTYLKLAIPDGILNTDIQYYWRVRAKNNSGFGPWSEVRNWMDSELYDTDVIVYKTRVESDGGIIIDIDSLNSAVLQAKSDGWWNKIKHWTSARFGIRKDGNNRVYKLYDLMCNDFVEFAFDIAGIFITCNPLWVDSVFNSKPIIRFGTGTNLYTRLMTGIKNASTFTEGEIFIVARKTQDPPPGIITSGFYKIGNTSPIAESHIPYFNGTLYDDFGSTGRKTISDARPSMINIFLYNVTSKSGEWTLRMNGSQIYTTVSNTVSFPRWFIIGGSLGFQNYYMIGDISEVMLLSACPTTAERNAINNYLNNLYTIY